MMTPLQAARVLEVLEEDSLKGIKRRFREMAIRYHPDKNKAADAKKTFQRYLEAYEVLEAYVQEGGQLPIRNEGGRVEIGATRNPSDRSVEEVTSAYAPMNFDELMAALNQNHAVVPVVGGRGTRVAHVNPRGSREQARTPAGAGAIVRAAEAKEYGLHDVNAQPLGQILIYGAGLTAAVRRALERGAGSVALPSNTCLKESTGTCTFGAVTARIEGGIAYVASRPYVLIVLPEGGSR